MQFINEIKMIRELLNMSQKDLAKELGVSFQTVNRWEKSKNEIEQYNVEKVYEYAYSKGVFVNKIIELFLKDENNYDENVLLFHGAKKTFALPVDLSHSKEQNDFGFGFYLGETFEQASTYICNSSSPIVYAFSIDCKDLKIEKFSVSKEWMIAIGYFRGWLSGYENSKIIDDIVKKVNEADIVIAPIADNRMFDAYDELEEEYGPFNYGKEKFSMNEMYWIGYAKDVLKIKMLNASILLNNKRSQHVFEKNGFNYSKEDDSFVYFYKIID